MLDMVQTLFAIFSITPLLIPYTAAELNTRPRTNVVIVGMVKEIMMKNMQLVLVLFFPFLIHRLYLIIQQVKKSIARY